MKRLLLLLLFPTLALAQTVPNGGITQGQVWSVPQWVSAWQSKADTASPAFTGTATIGGVQVPTVNAPAFTGTITLNGVAVPTVASPPFTGTPTVNGIAIPTYPRTAAEITASITPSNYTFPAQNVQRYGAQCDGTTNDTTAIQNAITALPSTGGMVVFPSGVCIISAPINIVNASVYLLGQGAAPGSSTVLKSTSNSTKILNITGAYVTVSGFGFDYSTTPVSGATAIYSSGANNVFELFFINKAYIGVEVATGSAQMFHHFQIFNYVSIGFFAHDINDVYVDTFILNAGNATNGALGGIRLFNQVEAFTASNADILLGVYSITTDATTNSIGTRPAYSKFTQVFFDSAAQGSAFNNSVEFGFTNDWFSGGRSGGGFPGASLNTVDSFRFSNTEFFNNGGNGLSVGANAKRVVLENDVFESNSVTAGNGIAHGVAFAGGATDFVVHGCIAHNGLYTGQQGWGIIVNGGASNNYNISDNLLTGNFTGGLTDGGSGTTKSIKGNVGFNPIASTSITVTASPFTFQNNTGNTANVFVTGGTVSSVTVGGNAVATATNTMQPVPQGASIVVTYTVAPTMTYLGT